jgi:hypothetical protein
MVLSPVPKLALMGVRAFFGAGRLIAETLQNCCRSLRSA